MDAEPRRDVRPGGTVEPIKRVTGSSKRSREPEAPPLFRYELRDPFEEVTYRLKTLQEMVGQAERLGATRFHGIAADGTRVPIEKVDGDWKRVDAAADWQAALATKEAAPTNTATAARTPVPSPAPEAIIARIDAEAALAHRMERLERDLRERYVIKRTAIEIAGVLIGQTEYRYRGDSARIAFTESTFRLATESNSPSVARSMVDVSEARRWPALRISGHEDFRRMVWLEASVRGIETIGYEPTQEDRDLLRRERDARQVNRVEPAGPSRADAAGGAAAKPSERGNGGRKAVLAALEAVLVAKRVPLKQREAVMNAAAENLAARVRNGEVHKVKVFDRSAPVQRPLVQPARELQRTQGRPDHMR